MYLDRIGEVAGLVKEQTASVHRTGFAAEIG